MATMYDRVWYNAQGMSSIPNDTENLGRTRRSRGSIHPCCAFMPLFEPTT